MAMRKVIVLFFMNSEDFWLTLHLKIIEICRK